MEVEHGRTRRVDRPGRVWGGGLLGCTRPGWTARELLELVERPTPRATAVQQGELLNVVADNAGAEHMRVDLAEDAVDAFPPDNRQAPPVGMSQFAGRSVDERPADRGKRWPCQFAAPVGETLITHAGLRPLLEHLTTGEAPAASASGITDMPTVKRVRRLRGGRGDWVGVLWRDAREPPAGFAQASWRTGGARRPRGSGDGRSHLTTRRGPWRLGPLTGAWLGEQRVYEGFPRTEAEAGVAA